MPSRRGKSLGAQTVPQLMGIRRRLIDQANARDVVRAPADPELVEAARLAEACAGREVLSPNFDFQRELRKALHAARLGVRRTFAATPAGLPAVDEQMVSVKVPEHLATQWSIYLSDTGRSTAPQGVYEGYGPDTHQFYAEVTWGVSGGLCQARVDWGQGVHFNVWGSQVQIRARMPARTLVAAPHGYPMTISTLVVPGGAPSTLCPTYTVRYGAIGPTLTTSLPIPRFAKEVSILCSWTTYNYIATFTSRGALDALQGANTSNVAQTPIYTPRHTWIPVPPYATGLSINNLDVAGTLNEVVAIYRLSLN